MGLSLLYDLDESSGCGAYRLSFTREKDERKGMREAKFRAEMTVEFEGLADEIGCRRLCWSSRELGGRKGSVRARLRKPGHRYHEHSP